MSSDLAVFAARASEPTIGELKRALQLVLAEAAQRAETLVTFGEIDLASCQLSISAACYDDGPDSGKETSDSGQSLRLVGYDAAWIRLEGTQAFAVLYFDDVDRWDDDFDEDPSSPYFGEPYTPVTYRDVIEEERGRAIARGVLQDFPFDRAIEARMAWWFRMQGAASQHTLFTGFVATALARITEGFLASDNGAIDYARSPAEVGTFLDWFPHWLLYEDH